MHRIGGRQDSIRSMLSAAGVGDFNATMSIPYMYFLPRSCDPNVQGVMQLVEGLQNLLNAKGAHLTVNGWMGAETAAAVRRFGGATWRDKTWLQLYGDVMRGRVARGQTQVPAAQSQPVAASTMGGLVDDLTMSPLAWLAGGAAAYYFLRGGAGRPRTNR